MSFNNSFVTTDFFLYIVFIFALKFHLIQNLIFFVCLFVKLCNFVQVFILKIPKQYPVFSKHFSFYLLFAITLMAKKEPPRKSWSKSGKREGGRHTVETERCPCSSEYQLAGLFDGCDMHDIMGSDIVGFKRTLLLQETLRCVYLFELWDSPNICPAVFIVAWTQKQPKCPPTKEWIKMTWYIYTMECYSAIKRNEMSFAMA